jgi:hypothetical protein
MPVRGDWLVELRGFEPLTSAVRLQGLSNFWGLLRFSIHDQSVENQRFTLTVAATWVYRKGR